MHANFVTVMVYSMLPLNSGTIVFRLSKQLEPRSFVRTLPVGAYFRRSIPKSPAFRCNVEETDRQVPE
jgi:hypothetical protein